MLCNEIVFLDSGAQKANGVSFVFHRSKDFCTFFSWTLHFWNAWQLFSGKLKRRRHFVQRETLGLQLYVIWHWYWHVEADYSSVRKARSDRLKSSYARRMATGAENCASMTGVAPPRSAVTVVVAGGKTSKATAVGCLDAGGESPMLSSERTPLVAASAGRPTPPSSADCALAATFASHSPRRRSQVVIPAAIVETVAVLRERAIGAGRSSIASTVAETIVATQTPPPPPNAALIATSTLRQRLAESVELMSSGECGF